MNARAGDTARAASLLGISARYLATVCLGVGLGALVLFLATLEARWLVYVGGGLAFLTVVLMARNKEQLLWFALVLALQVDVSFRLLYGHAGGEGLTFPLPIVVGMVLFLWYALSGTWRTMRPIRWGGPFAVPIICLFATSLLALGFSSEKFVGVTELLTQAELYLVFLLAYNANRTQRQLHSTFNLLLAILLIQSLVYYVQSALGITFDLTGSTRSAGELPRPGGTVATHPSAFCDFTVPLLLIAVGMFLASYPGERRAKQIGTIVLLGIGALVLTFTRAAWGASALGLLWIILVGYRRRLVARSRLGLVGLSALLVALAAAPAIMHRMDSAPLERSYQERAALMQMALEVIAAHPIVGVGPGAYESTYKAYLTPELAGHWQWTVHNYYLLRAAETGIPGGLSFIALLVVALRQGLRMMRSNSLAIRPAGLGYSAAILGLCFLLYWDMWTVFPAQSIFWFVLGTMSAAETLGQGTRAGTSRDPADAGHTSNPERPLVPCDR